MSIVRAKLQPDNQQITDVSIAESTCVGLIHVSLHILSLHLLICYITEF